MIAYIINLDRATERWEAVQNSLKGTSIQVERVPAVDGATLGVKHPDYSERSYRFRNGRATNPMEVGCYLSHVKAIKAFLQSGEKYGMICEDDIVAVPNLDQVLEQALEMRSAWNVLRLTGLTEGRPIRIGRLGDGHSLYRSLGRLKGAGAYVLDRKAAMIFSKCLLPMRLPYDHAIDREWFYGLRAAYILPFPISQTEGNFPSQIQKQSKPKFSSVRRSFSTYPYQVYNEISRWIFRYVTSVDWKSASKSASISHASSKKRV
jgi:glycosyl transferase, family 25